MKINDIISVIEGFAPRELAEDNDRVKIGLQIGAVGRECTGVLACLDCTLDVIRLAVENGCNLVISHHPTIYNSLQQIDLAYAEGRVIEAALKHDITIYSAHTNLDKSAVGINAKLIEMLGGTFVRNEECLFFATLPEVTLGEFAKRVSVALNDNSVKVVGDCCRKVKCFCICSGGGGAPQNIQLAREGGADVYLTGDIPHHAYLYAEENDFLLVEYSHYNSEIIAEEIFCEQLNGKCGNIKIMKANQRRPFRTMEEI